MSNTRDFDVLVFGATGFTGRRTAEYLARRAPPELRWAIAGRNRQKLEALRQTLVSSTGTANPPGVVEASVDDEASLVRAAERTRVLLTLVGPFSDYGEPVVRACIAAGTDYVDSTGEPHFVDRIAERYAAEAEKKAIRLVPSSGFDAAVADLGAFFTVRQLPRGRPIRLSGYLSFRAVFSGGTERSAIKSLASLSQRRADGRVENSSRRVREAPAKTGYRRELSGWGTPLPTIDPSVVVRSARSLDEYGPDFTYAHYAFQPTLVHVVIVFVVFGALAVLARIAPFRALFLAMAKKSGEGPTEAQMDRAWFKLRFLAECDGRVLQTEVSGGDLGYRETSKLLAEAAMCLALDRESLPARFGLLTPVEAMGERLLERAERAGIRFTTT